MNVSEIPLRVRDRRIAHDEPPYVIAEIGVNHDGSVDRAIEMVHAAAAVGADAVKLQWFEADLLVGGDDSVAAYQRRSGVTDQRAMLKELELTRDELATVAREASRSNLAAIVTVFSTELVDSARTVEWDAWKTASPDIVHRPLLDALAKDGRPMLVSTGASDLEEVVRADRWLSGTSMGFLHCVSAYPTPEDSADLSGIRAIAEATGRTCGYSDHTAAVTTGGLAVAAGACILEKHLTWSREARGPDHRASMEAEPLGEYIAFARRTHLAMGEGGKSVGDHERDVRRVARQSIRAAADLPVGTVLADSDLLVKRPGDGLEPWRLGELLGRRLIRPVSADDPIRTEDLEEFRS
mgnify:CR=1 FL=1